jgi:hypothetical protein
MTQETPADPGANRLFRWAEDIPDTLWQDLAGRRADEAAACSGAVWDGRAFALTMLGRPYLVDPGTRRITRVDDPRQRLSYQSALVLINALAHSRGVPPAGRMVTPQELPGGSLFFQGPHAINARPLRERFGGEPGALPLAARALGGEPFAAGDAGARVPGLPLLPLYVLIWAGDEEFAARAVVGLDAHAHHHLALDGLWALTNLLVRELVAVTI